MKTLQEMHPELAPAHVLLIDSLLAKGLTYSGSGMKNGERCLEVKSEGNEIVIHPSGKVELFTEFLDPSDPSDLGHHVWTVQPDNSPAEIANTVSLITNITGDN